MVVARPWLIMIQHRCNPMRPPQDPITAIQYTFSFGCLSILEILNLGS
jgi:hypothetical protein